MGDQKVSSERLNLSDDSNEDSSEDQARREFLKKAGRFAAVTPPAITLLLGTSLGSKAIAGSAGAHPGKRPGIFRGKGLKNGKGPKKPVKGGPRGRH